MLSDLPRDLAEEVLMRLPMTCNRAVRSVCKKWNTLSKSRSLTKKHLARVKARESMMVVIVISFRVYLMSVNLNNLKGKGVDDDDEPCLKRQGKLISLDDYDRVDIGEVHHCDGLLLCVTKDETRFVVWNPFSGQTRWFKPRTNIGYNYAIGYEENSSSKSRSRRYKVLTFDKSSQGYLRYALYYVNSTSSKDDDDDDITIPVTIYPDWFIESYARGVSLNGNAYWFAQGKMPPGVDETDFLICFDFTTERFGPHLTLPFHSYPDDTVSLSSVRDEQLAVLFQQVDTLRMEIWITTKIEPQTVSWSKLCFLAVDMAPLLGYPFELPSASFFVDEDKKLAVVFQNRSVPRQSDNDMLAYIIGEDGYFEHEDLGGSSNTTTSPLVCSFVPSLAQIKPPRRPRRGSKRKQNQFII